MNKEISLCHACYPMVQYHEYSDVKEERDHLNEENNKLVKELLETKDLMLHFKSQRNEIYKSSQPEIDRLNAVIDSHKAAESRILAMLDEERRKSSYLKAEVERIRVAGGESEPKFVLLSEYRHLMNEYERLRNAGDDVLREWSSGDEKEARNFMKALLIWNAAKEGKPSV